MGAIAWPILLSAAGGMVANTLFAPKPSSPGSPTPAPKADAAADQRASQQAADMQKKKAAAAGGRNDTLLTGPGGLGEVGDANKSTTSLLGY